jgi:hypothetical protein
MTPVNGRPILSSETAPHIADMALDYKPQLSDSNKYLVLDARWDLTPRLTGRLTVGRNMTLTCESVRNKDEQ